MVRSRGFQIHLRSLVNFAMRSQVSEAIHDWVRREIVDDDPWDEASLPLVLCEKSDRSYQVNAMMHTKR